MQFEVNQAQDNGLHIVTLHDKEAGTSAAIIPGFGAMLHAFTINIDGETHNIIDNYGSFEDLKKSLPISFKSSKLSPFACRIQKGIYEFEGRVFELDTKFNDGNAIHGLLYNKPFVLINQATDQHAKAAFSYVYDKQDSGYPYTYICEITYTLSGSFLTIDTVVTNQTDHDMPLTDGWHPYFTLGGKVNNWTLSFDAEGMLEFDDKLIPTGNVLEADKYQHPSVLGDVQLDNCFVLRRDNTNLVASRPVLKNLENGLYVRFYPDENYRYLQLYIPEDRNSIAIENLTGAPNSFNNGMGLIVMEPETSRSFRVVYEIGHVKQQ